jgi:serine/threonine-protein kinase ULK/ATG1
MNIANVGRSSPSSQGGYGYGYGAYPSSPRSFDSNGGGGGGGGIGSLPLVGKYFPQSLLHNSHSPAPPPPPPAATASSSTGPARSAASFSFPSGAICRAILSAGPQPAIASRSNGYDQRPTPPQPPQEGHSAAAGRGAPPLDAVETQLLAELEEFACKALVVVQFANEKLQVLLPPPPSAVGGMPAAHASSSSSSITSVFAGPVGAFVPSAPPTQQQQQQQQQQQNPASDSLPPSDSSLSPAAKALVATEALVLYIKALAFLNKAIRHAVAVVDWKKQARASLPSHHALGFSYETGCGNFSLPFFFFFWISCCC